MSATREETSGVPKAKWASEQDFNKYCHIITELYYKTTVPGIIEVMERRYSFFATAEGEDRQAAHSSAALIRRTPVPEPGDASQVYNEELMYRVLRDYYDASFAAQRWAVEGLAVKRNKKAHNDGQETFWRFRSALNLLEKHSKTNTGRRKDGDFAQGVLLMRVAFAELSKLLHAVESPQLFPWLLHAMVLFNESPARDFRPVETQLLKHLRDLTTLTPARSRHPTSPLWRALWSGGRGMFRPLHTNTVDLINFSILGLLRNGTGDPEVKSARFRDLLSRLEGLGVYDDRHINVLCCWVSHYRHHGSSNQDGVDVTMIERGIALLQGVLADPDKVRVVENNLGGAFNIFSLLSSMHHRLGRFDVAESYMRRALVFAEIERAQTGEDRDLLEGYIGLEIVLRAQGNAAEADAVREERACLVREALKNAGEKEDSV
ncbi:hypothetical protein C7999DRAFT_38636 [Corynascus novoguineensis]|uniref:Uncharacterized protein n=1 Tax=Corynascus novoguineensis TaxID=1126955 RepID=A0AAN7CY04_9PEZI|nr:hypothetical protein C7999DRAFT_38636 [Corynascus novoguineensis]